MNYSNPLLSTTQDLRGGVAVEVVLNIGLPVDSLGLGRTKPYCLQNTLRSLSNLINVSLKWHKVIHPIDCFVRKDNELLPQGENGFIESLVGEGGPRLDESLGVNNDREPGLSYPKPLRDLSLLNQRIRKHEVKNRFMPVRQTLNFNCHLRGPPLF